MYKPGGWVLEGATEDPDLGGLRYRVCWDTELGEAGTRRKSRLDLGWRKCPGGGTGPTLHFKLNLKVCGKHRRPPRRGILQ